MRWREETQNDRRGGVTLLAYTVFIAHKPAFFLGFDDMRSLVVVTMAEEVDENESQY